MGTMRGDLGVKRVFNTSGCVGITYPETNLFKIDTVQKYLLIKYGL